MTAPQIHSVGPPPALHADRVVAEMLRRLAQRRAGLWAAILEAVANSKDGGPRAQRRMAARIRRAGADYVELQTGTRGRYELHVYTTGGWDAGRDDEIGLDDPIPTRPWVVYFLTVIRGRGAKLKSWPVLFITHHALSRTAQRFGMRSEPDLEAAANLIWTSALNHLKDTPERWFEPPARGHFVPLGADGIVILERHRKRPALVAVTAIPNKFCGDGATTKTQDLIAAGGAS
jgi:hypothetical protein